MRNTETMHEQRLTRRDTLRGIGVATLGFAGIGLTTAQETTVTVKLDPQRLVLAPGETATVDIVVEGAASGIGAYQTVLVELGSSVATITDYEQTRSGVDRSEIRNDGQTLALSAALLDNTHPPAAEIVIARATIAATSTGQTTVAVDGGAIVGRERTKYRETAESGNVVVESGNGSDDGNGGENGTGDGNNSDTDGGNGDDSGTDGGDDNGNDSDDGNDSDNSDGSGPGFGVGGALAGVGGAGYLLKRRFDDENSE